MLKNKMLHERIEQPFNGSKRKAFRAVSEKEDLDLYLALYAVVKGPVRNQLLCMRGQSGWNMPWRWFAVTGNERTMVEINV